MRLQWKPPALVKRRLVTYFDARTSRFAARQVMLRADVIVTVSYACTLQWRRAASASPPAPTAATASTAVAAQSLGVTVILLGIGADR
jgi:hypothetical protein